MNWLIDRLKEKSTWLALFTFAGLFGVQIEPELRDKLMDAILAVAALVAFIFRESIRDTANSDQVPPIDLPGRSELPIDTGMDNKPTVVSQRMSDRNDSANHHQSGYRVSMQSKPDDGQESGWNG